MSEPSATDILRAIYELGQRIETRFSKLEADIARIEGRMADMPTARDFGRLEGRVAEMSERLPTTIGYQPPTSGKKRA